MHESELWLTALLNHYLSGPANSALAWVGLHAENPAKPWSNYVSMELLAALLIVIVFALLRPRLSAQKPGGFQHIFELIFGFLRDQSDEVAGHGGRPYVGFFATIFLFILFCNMLGLVPTLESPTMYPPVPLGAAVSVVFFYVFVGVKEVGIKGFLGHLCGPVWWLASLMFPIEIISNLARPLSLTIRLYANMLASEQVFLAFLGMTYLVVPVLFEFEHVFVAFLQAFVFSLLTMVYISDYVGHEAH